jgi:hypothetical protein
MALCDARKGEGGAMTAPGGSHDRRCGCDACVIRNRAQYRRHYAKRPARADEVLSATRARRIAEGVCPDCGAEVQVQGMRYCKPCMIEKNRRERV